MAIKTGLESERRKMKILWDVDLQGFFLESGKKSLSSNPTEQDLQNIAQLNRSFGYRLGSVHTHGPKSAAQVADPNHWRESQYMISPDDTAWYVGKNLHLDDLEVLTHSLTHSLTDPETLLKKFLRKEVPGFLFEKVDAYSPLQNKRLKHFLWHLKTKAISENWEVTFVITGVEATVCVKSAVSTFRALGFKVEVPMDAVVAKDKQQGLNELTKFCEKVGAKVTKTIDYNSL